MLKPVVTGEVATGLFRVVTTVVLSFLKTFKAKDHFKVGEVKGVKIGWLGSNFKKAFLSGEGKIETDVAETLINVRQLLKSSVDTLMISALGGEVFAELMLAQVWQMLTKQGHGEAGYLRVDGYANIFYIRDSEGQLWAVYCDWRSDDRYWEVTANSITDPRSCRAGNQVISH